MHTPYRLMPSGTPLALVAACGLALGWSAKKGILGKRVYNDSGENVGRVEDLNVNPDRKVSYVIVGAGGFIGIGRHDVAVPIGQIRQQDGRFLMAGAKAGLVKARRPVAALP
jgi:PRC-barrel domain